MTDKIILVVSFGTSYNNNRALTIGAIEKDIDEAFPDYEMRRAFTSQMVINILKKRDDLAIDNVEEALERALKDGVKTVVIQPTHIMNGTEYHFKIKDTVDKYVDKFENIPIAEPLLISDEDFEDLIASITSKGDYNDDTAVVFGADYRVASTDLYAVYEYWCRENALTALRRDSFVIILRANEKR